jgi:hypothetical protein
MTVVILGLTWGGNDYAWSSAQVIATLVVGTAVSVAFMMWQWKGPKYPLIPCKTANNDSKTNDSNIKHSAHLQIQDRQRCMFNHGHQWLELRYASLLHPVLLPTRLRLLCNQVRSYAPPNHTSTNSQQYSLRAGSTLDWSVSRVYTLRLAMLGCWPGLDVDSGREYRRWETNWLFCAHWSRSG